MSGPGYYVLELQTTYMEFAVIEMGSLISPDDEGNLPQCVPGE